MPVEWRRLSEGYYVRGDTAIVLGYRHWYIYAVAWPPQGAPVITHADGAYVTLVAAQRAARAL